ncbi:MAG TPA: choice-of-anchor L domain-containing protein, partial [Cyclobacteriaceae bacterium]|nr:choice-of-anchor L domain-containing protein [Cyclobacteriaceae bacterium]
AFFITGPGHDHTNIAVLPGEKIPITVNSINNKRNTKYYVDNEYINTTDPYLWDARKRQVIINKNYLKDPVLPPYHIEFDGFTRVIQARCTVIPNEVYSIKIAIADVADPILDSGVFLEGGSFSSFGDELVELINPFESEEEITSINEQIEIEEEEIAETEMQQQSETKEEGMVSFEKDIAIAEVANVIEFEFDKFELSEASQNIMWRIKEDLENKPAKKLLIIGHTDSIGPSDYNRWLSFMRSMTTFNWLNDRGIGPERMRISYYGELMPRDSNLTAEGRAKNRRVELFLISTEE